MVTSRGAVSVSIVSLTYRARASFWRASGWGEAAVGMAMGSPRALGVDRPSATEGGEGRRLRLELGERGLHGVELVGELLLLLGQDWRPGTDLIVQVGDVGLGAVDLRRDGPGDRVAHGVGVGLELLSDSPARRLLEQRGDGLRVGGE